MAGIVLATIGSWGDLFPMAGLGVELRRRGHDVRLAASPAWSRIVEEAGLAFVSTGREVGFEEFADNPEIFGKMPFGLRAALRRFLFDQIDDVSRDLQAGIDGADLVVAHPGHTPAMNVAEAAGVPYAVATVFPSMLPSAHTVPGGSPAGPWTGNVGRTLNRATWIATKMASAALFDRPINQHRRRLSLPTVRAASIRLPLAAEAVLVHADPSLLERPEDWPAHVHITGEITWDRAAIIAIEPDLAEFLAEGSPPVLITLGSSNAVVAEDFFDLATDAVTQQGHRALVVTGPARWAPRASTDVFVTDFVPFSTVASRCRAAIHHAGAGTTKAFVRAGIPQLAVPRAFDQPDTARDLERLGVGITVPWRARRSRLSPAIAQLLKRTDLCARAKAVASALSDDGAARAAALLESRLSRPDTGLDAAVGRDRWRH